MSRRPGSIIGAYILDDDGNPKPEPDTIKWAMWFEKGQNRIVGHDHIGDVLISTVFLGLDHRFPGMEGPPILWETMIFRGEHDQWMSRYRSREDALAGHKAAVEMVKGSQADLEELERMAKVGGWTRKGDG